MDKRDIILLGAFIIVMCALFAYVVARTADVAFENMQDISRMERSVQHHSSSGRSHSRRCSFFGRVLFPRHC